MRLENHVAIITGGASGIGRATAELFVGEGARVVVVDRQEAHFDPLSGQGAVGEVLRTHIADVTDHAAMDDIVSQTLKTWSKIDILVTAAAISIGMRVAETPMDEWRRVQQVNVGGTFGCIRAVLPAMIERRSGSIVTVGSQLSVSGGKANAAYVTSKGAITSLTKSVALDYVDVGVRCNCVAPGGTDTPLLDHAFARSPAPQKSRQQLTARHAMKRLAAPSEIALAILYLASPESSFVTGTQLVIDGGWLVA
jgi:2-keto-3-deoxy-L-fuconate dehydrogenase